MTSVVITVCWVGPLLFATGLSGWKFLGGVTGDIVRPICAVLAVLIYDKMASRCYVAPWVRDKPGPWSYFRKH